MLRYRSKFLKEMQNGGGLSVFAPNPQPYRAPLQGLNPQVFQYNVNTAPLDTSNLIQVMQTKDVMDIKREQAAIERQKLTVEKELKEQELEYKKAKMSLDFYSSMLKMTGMKPGAGGQPVVDDITNSVRNQKNREILAQIEVLDNQMVDLSSDLYNKSNSAKITNILMKRNNLQRGITSSIEEQAERATTARIEEVLKGDVKGYVVNPELFEQTYTMRKDYWGGKENGYKPGVTLNEATNNGMVLDVVAAKKELNKLFEDANKAVDVSRPKLNEYGTSNVLTTETTKFYTDSDTAATNMANAILGNKRLRSAFAMEAGIKLFDPSKSEDDYRTIIKDIVKPIIAIDDEALDKGITIKNQMLKSDVVPEPPRVSRIEYVRSGGYDNTSKSSNSYNTVRTETRDTEVSGGMNNTIDVNKNITGPEKINTVFPNLTKNERGRSQLVIDEIAKQGFNPNEAGVDNIIANFISSEAGKKAVAKDINGAVEAIKKLLKEANITIAKKKGDQILGTNRPTKDLFDSGAAPTQTTPPKPAVKLATTKKVNPFTGKPQ